ncbi:hypothetical protein [uncultured Parasphingopyxis sp.]|uniref:hypothetical protein n=1 Tax=uncultured Parasphingopyxis sp. TaxID=1547918 RepID=UPI0026091330|nr:hypothetical protein [uncultured Parasphingopyxis sp.]
MKRSVIATAAAIAISTAAYAGTKAADTETSAMPLADVIAQKLAQTTSDYAMKMAKGPDAYTGMGGPLEEQDGMTTAIAPGTRSIVMSQPAATFQPIERASYPICSATITDNCQQR